MEFLRLFSVIYFGIYVAASSTTEKMASSSGMKKSCMITLDNQEKWDRAYAACKHIEKDFEGLPLTTKLEEFDYDDKCYLQCLYKQLEILTLGGNVERKDSIRIWQGNFTAPTFDKVKAAWITCIDESEKLAERKKEANKCKTLTLQSFCFKQKLEELRSDTGFCSVE